MKPLLLLDVDGPLNPYAAPPHRRPAGYETHRMSPTQWGLTKPLRVWLNPTHGPALLSLPYTLVWATTWEDDANRYIAPVLGLPELPVLTWPTSVDSYRVSFKVAPIVEYAKQRGLPFAWVDDEIGKPEREYADTHPGPCLLHRVDPSKGLRPEDFAVLREWAERLPQPHPRNDR